MITMRRRNQDLIAGLLGDLLNFEIRLAAMNTFREIEIKCVISTAE